MKMLIMLVAALILSGCTSETTFGRCIGAFDEKDPALRYELSVKNVAIGVIFIETIFVPVIVVANQTLCPEGRR